MSKYFFLFVLLLFILGGCASQPQAPQSHVNTPAQFSRLSSLTHWQVKGKIAVKHPDQSVSTSMRWNVSPEESHFTMTNFLGVTLADMHEEQGVATIEADGNSYSDTDTDRLLEAVTGLAVPIAQLKNWIKGLPNNNDDYVLTDKGLVYELTPQCNDCQNWQVSYGNYKQVNNVWLPYSVTLKHKHDTKQWIKIRITQWQIN